uniref:uncharacterized protein LOC122593466 n=1 Tax=Erigeron canadensis TaxID=72917 RepID=UPI001CB935C4|nr:uncharacterized protein LOC122593466 [Erigeron canadensis]
MKLIISLYTTTSPRIFPHCSSSSGRLSCFHNTNNTKKTIRNNEMRPLVPARDIVIDFGKHKGKMLGMLSSDYLKWMSKNMNMDKWGKLAEDVLNDEVYADRIEWEVAERLLSGGDGLGCGAGVAAELESISKRFGWDYNDKVGWSKVEFGLLGTSKGRRLPRVGNEKDNDHVYEERSFKKLAAKRIGGEREKRRERGVKRREQRVVFGSNEENEVVEEEEKMKKDENYEMEDKRRTLRFPGRRSLINKVLLDGDLNG